MPRTSTAFIDFICALRTTLFFFVILVTLIDSDDLAVITALVMFAWMISGAAQLNAHKWRRQSSNYSSLKDSAAMLIWPLVLNKIRNRQRGKPNA